MKDNVGNEDDSAESDLSMKRLSQTCRNEISYEDLLGVNASLV